MHCETQVPGAVLKRDPRSYAEKSNADTEFKIHKTKRERQRVQSQQCSESGNFVPTFICKLQGNRSENDQQLSTKQEKSHGNLDVKNSTKSRDNQINCEIGI